MKLEELSNRGAPEKQHETGAQINQTETGICNKTENVLNIILVRFENRWQKCFTIVQNTYYLNEMFAST